MKVDKTKWGKKTLGEIGQIITGSTPSTKDSRNYDSDDIPFFKPGDLNDYSVNELSQSIDSISYYGFENSRKLPAGTILVTCIGIIGKIGILSKPATCNQQINAIICNDSFSNRFIAYNILFHKDTLSQKANGPVVPIINKSSFSKYIIKVPQSIAEQRAIAAELDAVQKMIEGYKAQLADLDALAQSIFLDMFGDPITNPKGWEKEYLSNICIELSTGPFGSMLHKTDYQEDGIPTINPQDIKNNKIKIDNIAKVSQEKAKVLFRYSLKENDIILARRGDLSKCAVITSKENGWLCGTGSFFLRLKNLLPIIFYHQYTTDSIQKYLNNKSAGATMPNLNQGILSQLLIAIPPLPLQQQFAERVEAIERQKELLQAQLAEAQTLMAERMQYYFD